MDLGKLSIRYEEEFITNSRGTKLFTCKWMPAHSEPKGLVFLCHGFGMECSISMRGCGIRLAKAGYAVYGIDYEGHGKSSGHRCYIPNFDHLVNDCSDFFTTISETEVNKNKKKILMGESMGGAVVLHLHFGKPDYWDMAVLLAPMCKIAEDVKPHPLLMYIANKLARIFPKWRIIPIPDLIEVAIRVPKIRDEVRSSPLCHHGWPPIGSCNEILRVSLDLEKRFEEVSLPLLIIHGGDDRVNDPSASKLLHELAHSSDKTRKLYPGMWHSLIYGELPQNIEIVIGNIISWLDERVIA